MLVSQFTLLASTRKGTKPDFHGALGGDEAKNLYQHFFAKVQEGYASDKVKDGVFQYVRPEQELLFPACFGAMRHVLLFETYLAAPESSLITVVFF